MINSEKDVKELIKWMRVASGKVNNKFEYLTTARVQ